MDILPITRSNRESAASTGNEQQLLAFVEQHTLTLQQSGTSAIVVRPKAAWAELPCSPTVPYGSYLVSYRRACYRPPIGEKMAITACCKVLRVKYRL